MGTRRICCDLCTRLSEFQFIIHHAASSATIMDNEQTNKPQRVQDLWFEDGNLVIQTGNSQYRVYRGLLATCSGVFTGASESDSAHI